MRRRILAIGIVVQLLCVPLLPSAFAGSQQSTETKELDKIKEKVAKLGVGKKVKVRLPDNGEVKGPITRIDASSFAVSGRDIAYNEVKKVDKVSAISRGGWIAIAIVGGLIGIPAAVCRGTGCGG